MLRTAAQDKRTPKSEADAAYREQPASITSWSSAAAALRRELVQRIEIEIAKNMRLQILVGGDRLQVGPDTYVVSKKLHELDGAFLEQRTRLYTRIDLTGHCLSAMLKPTRR